MRFFFLIIILLSQVEIFAQDKNDISLNFNLKDTLTFEETYKAETKQIFNGKTQKTYNKIKYFYSFIIENISIDSIYSLGLKYDRIILDTKSGDSHYFFDTDSIVSKDSSEAEVFYKAMINKKFIYRIDKKYNVTDFKSNIEQINRIMDSIGIHPIRKKSYYTLYSNSNIALKYKILKQNNFSANKNLIKNKKDTVSIDILNLYNFMDSLNFKNDFFYIKSVNAQVETEKNKPNLVNGIYIFYELSGKYNADLHIDNDLGLITNYYSKINSSGNVIIKYSKKGLPVYIWPMSVEIENSFRLLKINSKFVDK